MAAGEALRLLFFGTPEFAVPALSRLVESRHALVGVVSQPDRPRGRGRKLEPTPVKGVAQAHGIPLIQPDAVGGPEAVEWMRGLAPDLGVVVAFGQFIPKRVRELPPRGLINAHASLLPRHRGAAPIPHAILAGDCTTGVSVMRIVREMDAGDVCASSEIEIRPQETAGELAERLATLAAGLLVSAVDAIAAGVARFEPQDHARATQAPKLDKEFGRIDWTRPREEVLRRIRAATPWPGVDLALRRSGRRFRVLSARTGEATRERPGRVMAAREALRVAALDGWVDVLRLQAPGRRPVTAAEFLRGARVPEDEEIDEA